MEINGVAHIQLSVNDFSACARFYRKLLPFLGMRPVFDADVYLYYVGGRTALAIAPADEAFRGEKFEQRRAGLHHVCFRARERGDVDAVHALVVEIGGNVVHPPEDGPWAPGYYSVLFEDPDGIRIEVNHVPGKGLFAEEAKS